MILLLMLFFVLVTLPHPIVAEEPVELEGVCSSSYECGPWSEQCEGGLKTRTCVDVACGKREIVERSFCENPGCTPNIECDKWGPCEYTGRTDKIFEAKIGFGGEQSRVCRDTNKCGIASFYQYRSCNDEFELKLSPGRECNQDFLKVIGPREETIAKINLDRWKQNKFDLAFVQGERMYCPSCYDTVKNNDEEQPDCGGSCKPCKTERAILRYLMIMFLWSGSAVFTFFSIRQYVTSQKDQTIFAEKQ
ncbi:MAG: hypothetical protein ABH864_03325 [archaeon]